MCSFHEHWNRLISKIVVKSSDLVSPMSHLRKSTKDEILKATAYIHTYIYEQRFKKTRVMKSRAFRPEENNSL